jgi:hypothetical protein
MKYIAERAGATLMMAPVGGERQLEILRAIASQHALDFVDTSPLHRAPVPAFLPHDGYFSHEGARLIACSRDSSSVGKPLGVRAHTRRADGLSSRPGIGPQLHYRGSTRP